MHTLAWKPATARRRAAKVPARLPSEERPRTDALLTLQRVTGNQSVERLLAGRRQEPGAAGSSRADGDLRGESEDEESDRRESSAGIQRDDDCPASATGVSLGESGPISEAKKYGLRTPIIVRGTNLADVLDSELVGASIDHTGSMKEKPSAKSNNSGFMAADKIPDDRHTSSIRDHLKYFDEHGGDGSYARLQMDLYKIPSCGIDTPTAIPNSGYRIKREVKAEGKKVVGIVTKTAEAVTIGEHSSTAGLTAKKMAQVTLRESE